MPEYIKRNKMLFLLLVMVAVLGLISASALALEAPEPDPLPDEVWVFPDDTHPGYDSDNPDHHLSIQAGVNAVAVGGTVNVAAGNYSDEEVVVETAGISILGDEGATLVGPGEGVESIGFQILAGGVTVDGFTISGFQFGITAGHFRPDDPPNGEPLGVVNGDPSNIMVEGTEISNNKINENYMGVMVFGWGNYVEYNEITSNILGLAVLTATTEGSGVDDPDNIVRYNQFTGNGPATAIFANPGAKINWNNISGNTSGLLSEELSEPGHVYSSESDVDATNNWWGDITGPYHDTKNPNGAGDSISDGVLFDPWLGHSNPELPSEATLVSPFNGTVRALFTSGLDGVTITITTEGTDGWVAIMLADPDEEDKGFPPGVDESAGGTLFFIESSTSLAGLPVLFEIAYGPYDEGEELPDIKLYRYDAEDGAWVLLDSGFEIDGGNLYFRARFTGFSLFGLFAQAQEAPPAAPPALPSTGRAVPYLAWFGLAILLAGYLTYRQMCIQGSRP